MTETTPEKTPLEGFIGVSRDFLRKVPYMSSSVAKVMLLPLAYIRYTKTYNYNFVEIDKEELRNFMYVKESYKKKKSNFNAYLDENLRKACDIKVDDIYILDGYRIDDYMLYIQYNQEALRKFFEGLKTKESGYISIFAPDLAKIDGMYTWQLMKMLYLSGDTRKIKSVYKRSGHAEMPTLRKDLGLGPNEYIRVNGILDRTRFENRVLTASLKEIAELKQFLIFSTVNTKMDEQLFFKTYFQSVLGRKPAVKEYKIIFHLYGPKDKVFEN